MASLLLVLLLLSPATPACGATCLSVGCDDLRNMARSQNDGWTMTCGFLENQFGCDACSP